MGLNTFYKISSIKVNLLIYISFILILSILVFAEEIITQELVILTIDNVTSDTLTYYAEINKPVEWVRTIIIDSNISEDCTLKLEKDNSVTYSESVSVSESEISIPITKDNLEYKIIYYTESPLSTESLTKENAKRLEVSSNLHYENILAYVDLLEERSIIEGIHIYNIIEEIDEKTQSESEKRIEYEGQKFYYDLNGNGMYDRVGWIIPHLSNETYEITLDILNVYSFLLDNSEWNVSFDTSGKADLRIHEIDFKENIDLDYIYLMCGNISIDNENIYNGTHILYSNYECNNKTSLINYFVHNAGNLTLMFEFGNETAYAYDPVSPVASNVNINPSYVNINTPEVGGTWTYSDGDSDPENATVYEWYINGTRAITNGLVAYYKLDTNNRDEISGNIYTMASPANAKNISAKVKSGHNYKVTAAGTGSGYIVGTGGSALRQPTAISYNFWVNLEDYSVQRSIMGVGASGGQGYGGLAMNSTDIFYRWTATTPAGDTFIQAKYSDMRTGWHNFVVQVRYGQKRAEVWLDGQNLTLYYVTSATNWAPDGSPYNNGLSDAIGLRYVNSWGYFNGSLDEVRVYNRLLTPTEINDIYNRTFYGQIGASGENHTITNVSKEYYGNGTTLTFGVTPYDGIVYGNQTNSTTTTVQVDTCTYSSGNWDVLCSDNCIISTASHLPNSILNLKGIGTFTVLADITANTLIKEIGCKLINKNDDGNTLIIKNG